MRHPSKQNPLLCLGIALLAALLSSCQVSSPSAGSSTTPSPSAAVLTPTSAAKAIATPIPTPVVAAATADPAISEWLKTHAWPLKTVEPSDNDDFSDLMPLKDFIGSARIVALGEGTHGTSEFFRMKHRLVRFLVQETGFNTFAIEANWPEARRVNDYVLNGEGDPAQTIAGMGFWTWTTQEVLDMIEWMRRHNKSPGDQPSVSFHGFDMQNPELAMQQVLNYLESVNPDAAAEAKRRYICFDLYLNYPTLRSSEQDECRVNIQAVMEALSEHQAEYAERSSPEAYAIAEHSARLVQQAERLHRSQDATESLSTRDRFMAENVQWLIDHAGPDVKIILWAHNGHVSTEMPFMGWHLRNVYQYGRDDMVVIGFAFNEGALNAVGMTPDLNRAIRPPSTHSVPPALPETFEWYAHSTGLPVFILNLNDLDSDDPATTWLTRPLLMRSVGAGYNQSVPEKFFYQLVLPDVFDAIIYIDQTRPTRLLPPQSR